jgi:hypothetical protein
MRDKKEFDFRPKELEKLSFKVKKLLEKKEKENKDIFKKLRYIFKH